LKKNITFVIFGVLILAIGTSLSTVGLYLPSVETSHTIANFHFPNGNLTTYEGEFYNVGGVYSTYYSLRDIIRLYDYSPHLINQNIYPTDLYMVFVTAEDNTTLHTVHLRDLYLSPEHFFVSTYDGEINVYLASPLSLNELEKKGYYGDWEVTFTLHHYTHGNLTVFILGIVVTLVGILLMTVSLKDRAKFGE